MAQSGKIYSMKTRVEWCPSCMKQVVGNVTVYSHGESENKWETVRCQTCGTTISDVLVNR